MNAMEITTKKSRDKGEEIVSIPTTMNRDSAGLEALTGWGVTIGFVNYVIGEGALEVPEFVPTRAELLQIVKYWEQIYLKETYFMFCSGKNLSMEIRLFPFTLCRILRILELLGDDAVQAVREVRDAFAKSIGLRRWNRFHRYIGPGHFQDED
jgi:hypothetical protein